MRGGLSLTSAPPPQGGLRRFTIAEEIRERLADDIVFGRLTPRMRLDEQMLADRYGVSRTPVREALKQLAVSGLAESRPRKGMVVAEMTPERLVLMFEALAELEASCARYAALRMHESDRQYLTEVHDMAALAAEARDADHYARLNVEFHAVILRGCGNTYLSEPAFTLRARALAFRRAQFHNSPLRVEHSFAEHRRVLDAILNRDGDGAFAAMRHHLAAAQDASAQLLRPKVEAP